MALVLSWLGLVGLVAWGLAWAAAWLVWTSASTRQNRRLALFLLLWPLAIGPLRVVRLLGSSYEWSYASAVVGVTMQFPAIWAYLRFIATLDTPLVRPLSWRVVDVGLGVLFFGLALNFLRDPSAYILDMTPFPHLDAWSSMPGSKWLGPTTYHQPVALFGIVAGADQLRRTAKGSLARRRARLYLIGFGSAELWEVVGTFLFYVWPGFAWMDGERFGNILQFLGEHVALAVLSLTLAYAILRYQMFDITVRIRRGAVRTVAIALLLGTLFAAASWLSRSLEPTAGAGVAVVLVAALAALLVPLQEVLGRLVDRVLPGPSPEAVDARKVEVFRAALQETTAGRGPLSPADALRLDDLQRSLGLSDRDRAILELAKTGVDDGDALRPGQVVLGRYTLLRPLAGGRLTDRAWAAADPHGQAVVVKRSPLAVGRGAEMEALREVRHPNVVRLLDGGDEPAGSFVVLEALQGSLADRLAAGPVPRQDWQRLARDVLAGLHALHGRGILHLDLKPTNILFDAEGRAKLADFDVAHVGGLEATVGPVGAPPVGTLRYMAPEQARGRPPTPQSDLFAAAATLYEALVGQPYLPVVPGESAAELRQRAARSRTFPSELRRMPQLRDWFAKGLDPVAERRFRSAKEMRTELARLLPSRKAVAA